MATLKIFTVFDSKTEAYLPPFYSPTRGHALRMFETSVNTQGHEFNRWASDYTLFELGEFDDQSALFKFHPAAVSLGRAIEFVKQVPLPFGAPNGQSATVKDIRNAFDVSSDEAPSGKGSVKVGHDFKS